MSELLAVLPDVARDKSPELVEVALKLAVGIDRFLEDAQRPAYVRFLRTTFAAPARAAGWKPKAGESAVVAELRPRLLTVAAIMGGDPALVAEARQLAASYLRSPETLDPQIAMTALAAATHGGDVALARQLDAAFGKTQDHNVRGAILGGMVLSTDPSVRAKAIGRIADHSLNFDELAAIVMASAPDKTSRDEVYAFVMAHLDDVLAALPFIVRPAIVEFGAFRCDEEHRRELDTIFKSKLADVPGGAKALAEAAEAVDVCVAKKKAVGPDIAKFLSR